MLWPIWGFRRREYAHAYGRYLAGDADLSVVDDFDRRLTASDIVDFRRVSTIIHGRTRHPERQGAVTSKRSLLQRALKWTRRVDLGADDGNDGPDRSREAFLAQITEPGYAEGNLSVGNVRLSASVPRAELALLAAAPASPILSASPGVLPDPLVPDPLDRVAQLGPRAPAEPALVVSVALLGLTAGYNHLAKAGSVQRRFSCAAVQVALPGGASGHGGTLPSPPSPATGEADDDTHFALVTTEHALTAQPGVGACEGHLKITADVQPLQLTLSVAEAKAVSAFFGPRTPAAIPSLSAAPVPRFRSVDIRARICVPTVMVTHIRRDGNPRSGGVDGPAVFRTLELIPGVLSVVPAQECQRLVPSEALADRNGTATAGLIDRHVIELHGARAFLHGESDSGATCHPRDPVTVLQEFGARWTIERRPSDASPGRIDVRVAGVVPCTVFGPGLLAPELIAMGDLWPPDGQTSVIASAVAASPGGGHGGTARQNKSGGLVDFISRQGIQFGSISLKLEVAVAALALPTSPMAPLEGTCPVLWLVARRFAFTAGATRSAGAAVGLEYALDIPALTLSPEEEGGAVPPADDSAALLAVDGVTIGGLHQIMGLKPAASVQYTCANLEQAYGMSALLADSPDVTATVAVESVHLHLDGDRFALLSGTVYALDALLDRHDHADLAMTAELGGSSIDRAATMGPSSPPLDHLDSAPSGVEDGDYVADSLRQMFLPHSVSMRTFQADLSVGLALLTYDFGQAISPTETCRLALKVEVEGTTAQLLGNPYDACELVAAGSVEQLAVWVAERSTKQQTPEDVFFPTSGKSPPCTPTAGTAAGTGTDSDDTTKAPDVNGGRTVILEGCGGIDGDPFIEVNINLSRNHVLMDTTIPGAELQRVLSGALPANVYGHMDSVDELLIEFFDATAACTVLNADAARPGQRRCTTWAPSARSQMKLQMERVEVKLDPELTATLWHLSSQFILLQPSWCARSAAAQDHAGSSIAGVDDSFMSASGSAMGPLQSRTFFHCPLKCMAGVDDSDSVNSGEFDQSLLFEGPFTCYIIDLMVGKMSITLDPRPVTRSGTARSIAASTGLKVRSVKQDDAQHSRVNVVGFQIDSHDAGDTADYPPLNCLAPCAIFGTRKVVSSETVSCALETEAISATVAHNDVIAVIAWFEAVQEIVTKDVSGYRWTQRTTAIVGRESEVASKFSKAVNGQYINEQGIVGIKYINVTFVNQVRRGYRPVGLVSGSFEADLQNWTSSLNAHADLKLAAALMDVKRSAWVPLLLASPDANDQITPWSMQLQAVTPPSDWIESSAFVVVKQQSNRKSKKTATNLLNADEASYWDGGTAKGDNWVLFEFHRIITLHRFRYYPRDTAITGTNVPKHNVLEVGESRHGPFQPVVDFQGPLGSKVARSPAFSATGKFWKWTVKTRYGTTPCSAHVAKVEFAQRAGGTMVELSSEQTSEFTVSTEAMLRLHGIMASWTRLRSTEAASADSSRDPPFIGSHKLVNMTGKPIAVMKGAIYAPSGATEVSDKSSLCFEFGDRSADSGTVSHAVDKRTPITHLDIIDIGSGEKAPRGWVTIKKDINRGRADCTQFFIYKRDMDSPPITDICLRHVDPPGSPHPAESVPAGFEEILRDVNGRSGHGTRLMHVCFRRGCGAPLIDVALAYINDNEALPHNFVALPRLVNSGYESAFPVQIGYKRHDAEYTVKPASATKPVEKDVSHGGGLMGSEILSRLLPRKKKAAVRQTGPTTPDQADSSFITGLVVFSSSSKAVSWRSGVLSDQGNWHSKYRKLERVDVSDGQANPTYVLHTREAGFPAITSLRISVAVSVPQARLPTSPAPSRSSASKPAEHDEELQADGWIRVLPALNANNTLDQPPMWLEFRRDVGASPVESIDFIYAESEPVPEGFMMLDQSLSMVANKGRIFKKRDIRMVFRLGEPPRMSFKLIKADDSDSRSAVLLDSGVARIGAVGDGGIETRREKDVLVETNVPLRKSTRPTITASACPSQHAAEFVFTCKVINEHSFTINSLRTDRPHGWPHDLHVRWTVMGDGSADPTATAAAAAAAAAAVDQEVRSRSGTMEGRSRVSSLSESLSRSPSTSRSLPKGEGRSRVTSLGARPAQAMEPAQRTRVASVGAPPSQLIHSPERAPSSGGGIGSPPPPHRTTSFWGRSMPAEASRVASGQASGMSRAASPREPVEPSPPVAKLLAIELLSRSRFKVPQIAFEVRGWFPVSHVEVYQESDRTIVLSPKWHGLKKARVSISVEIIDEIRVITISSPLVIRNSLDTRVQICYQQTLHDEGILATLDVGGVYPLPLGLMDKTPDGEAFVPLWRFWSREQNAPFYTTNPMDVEYLGTTDWIQQGAVGYVYRTSVPGTVPLWVRQPMDYLDALPAVTTNRFGYQLGKKVVPKPDYVLATEGYRVAGHVYTDEQPSCNPLYMYWNAADSYSLFTTDSHEGHKSGQPGIWADVAAAATTPEGDADEKSWSLCGVECYLPVHHGMLRVKPEGGGMAGDRKWSWSKEILHLHRNSGPPSRSLLCGAQQGYQYHLFECFIRSRLNSTEWTLDSPICIENSLPNNIYIALTSSPDEPPGSNCITIRPGKRFKTFPTVSHTLDLAVEESMSANYSQQYNLLEATKRGTYLWVSLTAITRRVVQQGVTKIGKHDTKRLPDSWGPEVAPIKAVELRLDSHADADLIARGMVHVDVRIHRSSGTGTFEFNHTIISPNRVAVQVIRTDSFDGWDDDLHIAWEVWIDLQMADTKTPQVALRNWSQPAKLVWDDTVAACDDIQIEFTGSPGVPEDMRLGVHTSKRNYGVPTDYTIFAQHHVSNLTGGQIQLFDDSNKEGLWHAVSNDPTAPALIGLFSSWRSNGMVLAMLLSRDQMVELGYETRDLKGSSQEFRLQTSVLTLDDLTGIQQAKLELAVAAEVSAPTNLDGQTSTVDVQQTVPAVCLSIGWHWGNQDKLWKCVTINPPVVVRNQCLGAVTLGYVEWKAEHSVRADPEPTIKVEVPGESMLPVVVNAASRRWFVRLDGTSWSCDFPLDDPGVTSFTIKLCAADGALITLDLRIEQTAFHKTLVILPSKVPPFRLENHCEAAIMMISQEPTLEMGPGHFPSRYLLQPGLLMPYAFDRCFKTNQFRVAVEDGFIMSQSRDGSGILVDPSMDAPLEIEYAFVSEGKTRKLHVLLFDENGTRVVMFSDSVAYSRRLYGLADNVPSEHLYSELSVALPRIGISIVDSTPAAGIATAGLQADRLSATQELFYVCITGILFNFCATSEYVKRHLTVADIMINHQEDNAQHQVFMSQSIGKDDTEPQPLVQLARVTKLAQLGRGRGFPSETHIAVGLQTVGLNVDAHIIETLKRLLALRKAARSKLQNVADLDDDTGSWWRTQRFVFDNIKLYPVEVHLTTSFEDLESLGASVGSTKGLAFKVLTAMVGKVHELPLKFTGFELEGLTTTPLVLYEQAHKHVWNQAIGFMSVHGMLTGTNVIGSLALFGDVSGAIRGLGGSIHELTANPDDDPFVDPHAFGAQLGRGTARFSTGVLGNVAGMGNKIAGSIGSGLAHFALDESYRRDRKSALSRKPSGFGHGIVSGVTQLGKGVISGVTGLVEKPLRGGQKGGVVGGLGGLGKGLAGLVIKPMTGAVDMVQSSFAGLESLASPSSRQVRVRDPRYIDPAGVITPYSWHKSMGRRFVHESFEGRYANYGYISHVSEEIEGGRVRMIFVLQRRVLVLHAQGKGSLNTVKIEKEIDSHRLEGLRMVPGKGIELWYTGSGAVMVSCHDRNVSRLSALLGDLIAMHQRSRRSRIASSSKCYFPDRSMVNRMTQRVLSTPKKQPKQHQSVLREVWENQRYIPWVGFTQRLLPTDRSPWSSGDGQNGVADVRSIRPSPGWRWIGHWVVDSTHNTDEDGWQYATDFPSPFVGRYNKMRHFVRRRRWTRQQEAIEPPE